MYDTIFDEVDEIENSESTEFKIKDDAMADWAIRKIAKEEAEFERIEQLGVQQIEKIEMTIETARNRCANNTKYLTDCLAAYFAKVDRKVSKGGTKESYRLLSGTLVCRKGKSEAKMEDEIALTNWLKATGRTEMVKTVERPSWGEFKKSLEVSGDKVVIAETGEIVAGVNVVKTPDKFGVEVNKL